MKDLNMFNPNAISKMNIDKMISCNVVDILFAKIHKRLEMKKTSLFWKNLMLKAIPKSCDDVKQEVMDMSDKEIDELLDDIQKELDIRKKIKPITL